MEIIRTVDELRQRVAEFKEQGKTVGLVPTMGALHAGHISLVDKARNECQAVVVSVFVNPTQFNNPTDLITYPRTEEADCALLEKAQADIAFIPSVEEMYPEPDTRTFDLGPVAEVMEGPMRPGHFNGVAQVVSKLFDFTRPHRAYFGEKDFQQIAVIKRMVEIEGFDIDIVSCPIMRHDDGLAMSSRNVRLTPEQRNLAPGIYKALQLGKTFAAEGNTVAATKALVTETINAIPFMEVEYFEIINAATMQPISDWADAPHAAGCITVYCGDVRLIDNIIFF
ncbi:MAG: pantoate--beta-alanine ligase [Muribaculaceae bacterium]|nr:pantoate--beta-alanine ligase [Muribaculaceae bacterium]